VVFIYDYLAPVVAVGGREIEIEQSGGSTRGWRPGYPTFKGTTAAASDLARTWILDSELIVDYDWGVGHPKE
jgi:hypothetical protein